MKAQMQKFIAIVLGLLLFSLILTACGQQAPPASDGGAAAPAATEEAAAPAATEEMAAPAATESGSGGKKQAVKGQLKIAI